MKDSPEGEPLDPDELVDILCVSLTHQGHEVLREARIDLAIPETNPQWGYPAIVISTHHRTRFAYIPRFGPKAPNSLPTYLVKYLDVCRKQHSTVLLYLATLEATWSDYTDICDEYGLGLVSLSIGTERLTVRREPTTTNIKKALQGEIQKLDREIGKFAKERLADICKRKTEFKRYVKSKGLSVDKYDEKFVESTNEIREQSAAISARLKKLTKNPDSRQFRELEKLAQEFMNK